ncbi:hypothetical protein GCM10010484_41490 [Actinokineospora globicatena]
MGAGQGWDRARGAVAVVLTAGGGANCERRGLPRVVRPTVGDWANCEWWGHLWSVGTVSG